MLPGLSERYLAVLDVVAFTESTARWPFLTAIFELENSLADRRVGYSLWKVLCVRAAARFVFAYRQDGEGGLIRWSDTWANLSSAASRLRIGWRSQARPR